MVEKCSFLMMVNWWGFRSKDQQQVSKSCSCLQKQVWEEKSLTCVTIESSFVSFQISLSLNCDALSSRNSPGTEGHILGKRCSIWTSNGILPNTFSTHDQGSCALLPEGKSSFIDGGHLYQTDISQQCHWYSGGHVMTHDPKVIVLASSFPIMSWLQ